MAKRKNHKSNGWGLIAIAAVVTAGIGVNASPDASAASTSTTSTTIAKTATTAKPKAKSKTASKTAPSKTTANDAVGIQVVNAAKAAGFTGDGLIRIVAVEHAENTSQNSHARLRNGPTKGCPHGSTDRGWVQFNDCYHPEISTQCADDLQCAMKEAYRVTNHGRTFRQWATNNNGRADKFISTAQQLITKAG